MYVNKLIYYRINVDRYQKINTIKIKTNKISKRVHDDNNYEHHRYLKISYC